MRSVPLLLVGAVLLSSCRLELDVNVAVEEDGRGSVEVVVGVDADGIERIGGDLDAVLEVDDLVAAGWDVDGPAVESDGDTRVRFTRAFADAEEAAAIFARIAGDDGPFQDFTVRRDTSFARSEWGFHGRLDFSGGLEAFGDEALAAELDGEPIGQSVEEIEAQLGEALSRAIQVRVSARLPGDVTSNGRANGADGAVWQVAFGDPPLDLEATGEERRTSSLVAAGVGVSCAILLVLYALARVARPWTARRRTRAAASDGVT